MKLISKKILSVYVLKELRALTPSRLLFGGHTRSLAHTHTHTHIDNMFSRPFFNCKSLWTKALILAEENGHLYKHQPWLYQFQSKFFTDITTLCSITTMVMVHIATVWAMLLGNVAEGCCLGTFPLILGNTFLSGELCGQLVTVIKSEK